MSEELKYTPDQSGQESLTKNLITDIKTGIEKILAENILSTVKLSTIKERSFTVTCNKENSDIVEKSISMILTTVQNGLFVRLSSRISRNEPGNSYTTFGYVINETGTTPHNWMPQDYGQDIKPKK